MHNAADRTLIALSEKTASVDPHRDMDFVADMMEYEVRKGVEVPDGVASKMYASWKRTGKIPSHQRFQKQQGRKRRRQAARGLIGGILGMGVGDALHHGSRKRIPKAVVPVAMALGAAGGVKAAAQEKRAKELEGVWEPEGRQLSAVDRLERMRHPKAGEARKKLREKLQRMQNPAAVRERKLLQAVRLSPHYMRLPVKAKLKVARVLSAKGRRQIKEEHFALPGRRYPIHDRSHARNALARVSQHGTPAEQAKVRAAVAARYPGIGKEKTAMFWGRKKKRKKELVGHFEMPVYDDVGGKVIDTYRAPVYKNEAPAFSIPAGAKWVPLKEKTAMRHPSELYKTASRKAMAVKALKGTALVGAGAVPAYVAGHRSGMARDAETPYGNVHMQYAYRKGQHDLAAKLRQHIAARKGTTKKAHANLRTPEHIVWG
jgi:hypothetical protein